jgi:RND superfamily putative drug exporter
MAFKRLADFIVKHYQLVIITWMVVLFYVFPFTLKINDVVVYQESSTGMEGLEAMEAQAIIDENFAGAIANSTIVLVFQDDSDVLSIPVRDLSWAIYQDITESNLAGVQDVSYLYPTLEYYYANIAVQAWDVLGQVGQTALMVYGVPVQIEQAHMYALAQSGYTLPDNVIMVGVLDGVRAGLESSGADSATIEMTMGYAGAFYETWLNWTPSKPIDDGNLTLAVQNASVTYFGGVIGGDMGSFAVGVSFGMTTLTFSSPDAQQMYTQAILEEQLGVTSEFVQQVWSIGHSPSMVEATTLAHETVFGPGGFDQLPVKPDFVISQFVNTAPDSGSPNTTMLMVVTMSVEGASSEAENAVRVLRTIAKNDLADAGLTETHVYVSGDPAMGVDLMDAVDEDVGKIDFVTVGLVVVLVLIFFRSIVTPCVPLMTVGMAYLTSMAFIFLMGKYVMEIHYSVLTIILTVMLGAGTDYCIFIMSRYREERVAGKPKEEAVRTSLIWAGESIATSGVTVMIGFGALMIGTYPLVRSMGMALVIAVGMALLFALTMLPALLMLVGDKVFWPHTIEREAVRASRRDSRGGGYFRKSARFALKNRKVIVLVSLIVAVPTSYLVLNLESSYDFTAGMPDSDASRGIEVMGTGFGKGNLMPTYIVVTFEDVVVRDGSLSPYASSQLEAYSYLLLQEDNVRSVTGPTRPFGVPIDPSYLENLTLDDRATYEYAIASAIGLDNRTVMLTVVLQDEPFTLKSIHTIDNIRLIDSTSGGSAFNATTSVLVGGSTAAMTDVSRSVSEDFFTMRVVVIIGIYFVLMVVLGSLIIPLRLILTVLLTVVITIAMTMILFQYYAGVPVLWMLPLLLFVIALGLGMDYDIFLTTRIREEVSNGKTDEQAIMTSVERTGGIITACGVIMAGAFGSMMLSSTALLREFGFGLAFAILLDAMIVRIYLVPAIMLMLQKWNWYAPGRLQRVRRGEKSAKPPRKH